MHNNDTGRNDSLKEIHTTFDSDGSVIGSGNGNKGGLFPKVLSVIAAIALWMYVFQAVEYEKTFNGIPVEIEENFDSTSRLGIVSNNALTVDITISGTKSNIDSVDAEDIRAFVDLSDVTEPDTYSCTIEVEIPANVDIVEKSSEKVRVEVDRTIESMVEIIDVNNVYTIESPYELGEISVMDVHKTPLTYFTLTGPETDISLVEKAVINLDLGRVRNSINSNINASSAVSLYDAAGNKIDTKYISIKPDIINVYIPVYKTKQVDIKPNVKVDTKKFAYETNEQTVDAYGLVDDVDRIGLAETESIEMDESTVYIVALKECEGVTFYKPGSQKNKDNIVKSVSINVSEIDDEKTAKTIEYTDSVSDSEKTTD